MTIELNPGAGGAKVRTSLTGSIETQVVKLVHGGDGVYTLASAADPFPVGGLISITGSTSVVVTSLPPVSLSSAVVLGGPVSLTGSFMDTVNNAIQVNVVAGGGSGGTSATDDAAFTAGTGTGTPMMGFVTSDSVDSGDVGVLGMTVDRSLYIAPGDVVSTNNSTTTPLGIGAAFTGTGDDVLGFSAVCITLFADEASATDGMTFQFSTDNSNWDDVYTFTMTASDTRRFQFPVCARYFRIVYTNGGTGQAAFRVQTLLHRGNTLTSIHRMVDATDPDRSATLVKSAIIAQAAGSGDFITVKATAGGNFKVAVEEFDAPVSITGSMSVVVQGVAAHDAAVAGNPLLTGLEARTTNPTAVADGDTVRAMADDMGRQIVAMNAPRDLVTDNHNGSLTLSTTLTLLPTGGAGVFRDLTAITISNKSATDALVTIFDGLAGGTERFQWEFTANGGGIALVFNTPFKQATANNGWGITSSEVGVSFTVQAIDTV